MAPAPTFRFLRSLLIVAVVLICSARVPAQQERHYIYVALPESPTSPDADQDRSVRVLVFDVANAHRFVKRIRLWPAAGGDEAETVRGTAASARTGRFYISTTRRLAAVDLKTDKIVWEKSYDAHCCDRFALSPDGQTIYAPAFGSPKWYVVSASSGELRATFPVTGWPRDTIYAPDGKHAYLAAWESPILSVSDAARHEVTKTVGPFSGFLCPFTLNAKGTLAFANIDGLVGFEVGDLQTGLILDSVAVEGVDKEMAAAFECPSHGIAFTPDERELWVADGVQNRLQLFDATIYPPALLTGIELAAQPRWITFGIDGRYAYPSTGDVVDVKSRKIVGVLEDDLGVRVRSESLIEVDFAAGQPVRASERIAAGAKSPSAR
jgi:DNA-binding beta-propeller fold protein YncE